MNKLYIEEYGSPRSVRPLLAAQPARVRKLNPKSVGSKFLPSSVTDIELRRLSSPYMDIYRPETLHNSTRFAKFGIYSALCDRKVHTQNTRYLPYKFRWERDRNISRKYELRQSLLHRQTTRTDIQRGCRSNICTWIHLQRVLMANDHKCKFHGITRFQP